MADDKAKKTKIDLKARLGRTTQMGIAPPPGPLPTGSGPTPPPPASDPGSGSGPGSAPSSAPMAPASRPSGPGPGSVRPPLGIAPPPGISVGIPLPAFGPQPRPAPRAEPKQGGAQQTIKVEIGEEIHEERKKARNRAMLAALAGAAIGLGIGFVAGGSSEKGDRSKNAARQAQSVEKDVKAATDKLKELDAKVTEATERLGKKEFPTELSSALAGIVVPYEVTILDKQVPGRLTRPVANFFAGVENVNKERETLKRLADVAKDPVSKVFKEETAPMANFSVIFRQDGKNVVADLVPNPAPFSWKGDWSEKYKVTKPEGNRSVEKEVKRYAKGDLPGNDLMGIPVDPKSMASMTEGVALFGRIQKALYDLRVDLQGKPDEANGPVGLLKSGDDLANELHKASLNQ